jgi:hypothetical protein
VDTDTPIAETAGLPIRRIKSKIPAKMKIVYRSNILSSVQPYSRPKATKPQAVINMKVSTICMFVSPLFEVSLGLLIFNTI